MTTKRPTREERKQERDKQARTLQVVRKLPDTLTKALDSRTKERVSPEQKDAILILLTEGHTLLEICKLEGAPSYATVNREATSSETFAKDLRRARELGAGALADEIVSIADEKVGESSASVQRNRLRCDVRARVAAWHNRAFSDKLSPEDVGSIVAATIQAARSRSKRKIRDITPAKAIKAS